MGAIDMMGISLTPIHILSASSAKRFSIWIWIVWMICKMKLLKKLILKF